MSAKRRPIGTYPTSEGGFAAYDKDGRAWRVTADEAAQINAEVFASKGA
jgi:hypothetical protein